MTLEQIDALIAIVQARLFRPGIWLRRDGTCRSCEVRNVRPAGVNVWEVLHPPHCQMQRDLRLEQDLKAMRKMVIP